MTAPKLEVRQDEKVLYWKTVVNRNIEIRHGERRCKRPQHETFRCVLCDCLACWCYGGGDDELCDSCSASLRRVLVGTAWAIAVSHFGVHPQTGKMLLAFSGDVPIVRWKRWKR